MLDASLTRNLFEVNFLIFAFSGKEQLCLLNHEPSLEPDWNLELGWNFFNPAGP